MKSDSQFELEAVIQKGNRNKGSIAFFFTFLMMLESMIGCSTPPANPSGVAPVLLEVSYATPILPLSLLTVRATDVREEQGAVELEIQRDGKSVRVPIADTIDASTFTFVLEGTDLSSLGEGSFEVFFRVWAGERVSNPLQKAASFARTIELRVDAAPSGSYHRDQPVFVRGSGFLAEGEGDQTIHLLGRFVDDRGTSSEVDVELPLTLVESRDRSRASFFATTAIGGLRGGQFQGACSVDSNLEGGAARSSMAESCSITIQSPELFEWPSETVFLGERIDLSGAGFLGSIDKDEITYIHFEGEFALASGGARSVSFDAFPAIQSSNRMQMVFESAIDANCQPQTASATFCAQPDKYRFNGFSCEEIGACSCEGADCSRLFESRPSCESTFAQCKGLGIRGLGAGSGNFVGNVWLVTVRGTESLRGTTVPVSFHVAPRRQVVYLDFLPVFFDTISRFGLSAVSDRVVERARQRFSQIYRDYSVDVRTVPPTDVDERVVTVVEIGGPDPDGLGRFGYEVATLQGKDLGNLRMYDRIGGGSFVRPDRSGGIFVQSFLYFSETPGLAERRPSQAPYPEPLFDEVFGPVRTIPVTSQEATGVGAALRLEQIARAISALGGMIGETSAHEFGHSLGLADPYGSADTWHNASDGPGCLMDSGADRPLGERFGEPGFDETVLCWDEGPYMQLILPKD